MKRVKRVLVVIVHVITLTIGAHAYHILTSDRMLDAAADVALDKAADIALIFYRVK